MEYILEHFRQKDMHLKQYLPRYVLGVFDVYNECSKIPFFTSDLEYSVELAKLCLISSSVGALWCSEMIALFKSLGSRNTHSSI